MGWMISASQQTFEASGVVGTWSWEEASTWILMMADFTAHRQGSIKHVRIIGSGLVVASAASVAQHVPC